MSTILSCTSNKGSVSDRKLQVGNGCQVICTNQEDLEYIWKGDRVIAIDAEWAHKTLKTQLHEDYYREMVWRWSDFISKQYTWFEDGKRYGLYVLDKRYPMPDFSLVDWSGFPPDTTIYTLHTDANEWNAQFMMSPGSDIYLLMYFALKDVEATMGKSLTEAWLLYHTDPKKEQLTDQAKGFGEKTKPIQKKRKVNGRLVLPDGQKVNLIDIFGTANNGQGLDSWLSSVNVDNPFKKHTDNWMKEYSNWTKAHMEVPATHDPVRFFEYAMGDTLWLEEGMVNRVDAVNKMLKEAIGLDELYVVPWKEPTGNEIRFPMSAGSLVSTTFERWLHKNYNRSLDKLLDFMNFGTSDQAQRVRSVLYQLRETGKAGYVRPLSVRGFNPNPKGYNGGQTPLEFVPSDGAFHPFSYLSIPAIGQRYKESTGLFNACVQGGRCVNERPYKGTAFSVTIKDVLDIDLNSCYGSALTDFVMALGFPKEIVYSPDEVGNWTTLGQVLAEHEHDFQDNLYQLVVEGKLSFEQDLVASKIGVDEKSIIKDLYKMHETDDGKEIEILDKTHIDAKMVHLKREIVNGVITSDILRTIRAVSTNEELKSWMSLRVKTAIWYPKSERCETEEELLAKLEKQKPGKGRPYQGWMPIKMSGFVGSFVAQRKVYKSAAKRLNQRVGSLADDLALDPGNKTIAAELKKVEAEYAFMDSLQNGLKLFINTTYGCFASPYFRMGNVVMANNITAKARLGAWMMNKALGTIQSITDGGAYGWETIRFLTGEKKPGFNIMADYDRLNKHRSIKNGHYDLTINGEKSVSFLRLREYLHGNVDLVTPEEKSSLKPSEVKTLQEDRQGEIYGQFEAQALEHINNFWGRYWLALPFKIEHKYENTALVGAYANSADYLFVGTKPDKKKQPAYWMKEENGRFVVTGADDPNRLSTTFKVRGAKEKNHPKKLALLAFITGNWDFIPKTEDGDLEQVFFESTELIGISEFQKTPQKFRDIGAMPGDEKPTISLFYFSDKHVLQSTVEDYRLMDEAIEKEAGRYKTYIRKIARENHQTGSNKPILLRGTTQRNKKNTSLAVRFMNAGF